MIVLAQHPATPDVPASAIVRTVAISDAGFSPSALVVAPGTTVTWTNGGRTRHSATADGGAFHSPTLIPGDASDTSETVTVPRMNAWNTQW